MNQDGQFDALMERLSARGAERRQALGLWASLKAKQKQIDGDDTWMAHLIEEAVTLRIISLRLMKSLGTEPILNKTMSGVRAGKSTLHPAVDALAKSQERLRKVMKELKEQQDAEAGSKPKGLPDIMVPILEKAEGVLENALRPSGSEAGPGTTGAGRTSDRDVAGAT